MEEYLNSIKAELCYMCIHYVLLDTLYLEIHNRKKLSDMELNHIKDVLKTWTFIGSPFSEPSTNVYTFLNKNIEQEIRAYRLKELIK